MSPTCLSGLLALTVAVPLPPRPVYQWKFETGRAFFLELTTDTRQEMDVGGQKLTQTQNQTFLFRLTPERQLPDGSWLVRQRLDAVRMRIDIGNQVIDFDSAKPQQKENNPLGEFFRALVGSEFRLTLDRSRGVVAVEGREEFLRRLGDANPQMKPLLQTILTDEALKEMNGQLFTSLPPRPVAVGDGWQRRSRVDLGPVGSYETTYRYRCLGSEGGQDVFHVDVTDLRYLPPQGEGNLPFKVKQADVKGGGTDGTMRFDRDRGRMARCETRMTVSGHLVVEIGGQETKVELKQEQTTVARTFDAEPAKK